MIPALNPDAVAIVFPVQIFVLTFQIDVASSGFIEYSEFLVAAMDEVDLLDSGKLRSAFEYLDVDKTGKITPANLKIVLSPLLTGDDTVDDSAISNIIDEGDTNVSFPIQCSLFYYGLCPPVP